MKAPSPRIRIGLPALGLGLAIALTAQPSEMRAGSAPALAVYSTGCHFSPNIRRALSLLPEYSDMQMHTDQRSARFAFENLHGIGVVGNWDAEWSEVRLYFREDLPALKRALAGIGLRVDGRGRVAVPRAAEDDMALSVVAAANDGRYFADAGSYLACGSV